MVYDDGRTIEYSYDESGNIVSQNYSQKSNLPTITIIASDNNASETGKDPGTFTISRTGKTTNPLNVKYTLGGTATEGTDYDELPGIRTIPAGKSSADTVITPVDDAEVEGDETVVITISSDPKYQIGNPMSATLTIVDNDTSKPKISVTSPKGGEKWEAGTSHTITWTYDDNPGNTVIIHLLKGSTVQSVIKSGQPIGTDGKGSFSWNIPANQAPGKDYKVRVSSESNPSIKGTSPKPFEISGAQSDVNLVPFKPAGWSDKLVISFQKGTHTDDTPLYATDTLYVDWTVLNNGTSPVETSFSCKLYVDGAEVGTGIVNPPLNPNYYAYWNDFAVGPFSAGTHTFKVVVDATKKVTETNELDNKYSKTVTISASSAPNLTPFKPGGWSDPLVVSNKKGTTEDSSPLYTTDTLYVNWAVINNGSSAAGNRCYFVLYVDGQVFWTWYYDPPWNPNIYVYVADHELGSLGQGTHALRLVVDSTSAISELHETDNEFTKAINVLKK